jgi:hypothetical protein
MSDTNPNPEFEAAIAKFDKAVADHGSVDAWIAHRLATEPDFVVIIESFNYGDEIPYISPAEAGRQLAEARAKKLSKAI